MPAKRGVSIYNTRSDRKEPITPLKHKKINLFVCGPTVYDFSHLGHARTYVIFDCFAKYLKRLGFQVYYLQNITNVDDKIIAKAREKGVPAQDLADAFEKDYLKDMDALGVASVKKYAQATKYIKEIIGQVQRLMDKGYAYEIHEGIYFNIGKFKGYGKLSGRTALQAEDAVSRIDYSKYKRNRGDFCLWKFTEGREGEPSWPSPFGNGRPGWHIEDTAITEKFFGPQYDIHGGGRDLMFPHHEAEISQMEALSGKKPMAKYWMHTGFLTIDGQKMSKSLNNYITIGDFLKRYSPQHVRFWIAKHLWRSPINYSESGMMEAKMNLEKIEEFLRKIKSNNTQSKGSIQNTKWAKALIAKAKDDFYKALNDDFNTPEAFAAVFEAIKEINKRLDQDGLAKKTAGQIYDFFKEIHEIFGIIDFKKLKKSAIPDEVKQLLKERETFRKKMEWQKADEMRKEIEKYGFLVEDTKEGSILKKL